MNYTLIYEAACTTFLILNFAAGDPGHNNSCGPLPPKNFGHSWSGFLPRLPFVFSGHDT